MGKEQRFVKDIIFLNNFVVSNLNKSKYEIIDFKIEILTQEKISISSNLKDKITSLRSKPREIIISGFKNP